MPFTAHHFRFTIETETAIELNAFKGSALRGAWQSHLRTLYCAQADRTDPLHQAICPVCFLLSRDSGSGDDRRPYALLPPLTDQEQFAAGQRLQFGFSLFGQAIQFMPYLVLAVGQMGQQQGLGKPIPPQQPGEAALPNPSSKPKAKSQSYRRGRFRLVDMEEMNLVDGQRRPLLAEGEAMVRSPRLVMDQAGVLAHSRRLAARLRRSPTRLSRSPTRLSLIFLTPTRIVDQGKLVHQPHFRPFFARLVDRIDALQQQYAAAPRLPKAERDRLLALAEQIKLVDDQSWWWDLTGHSTRLRQKQQLGGFIGQAVYEATAPAVWEELLPWLIWGTVTQVGKHVVKGCGWYRIGE